MYFPIIDHYFDDNDDDNDKNVTYNNICNIEYNECLICLEIIDNTNNNCIKLQNIFYEKVCLCDGWIHHCCLDNWFTNYEKCPICLCNMVKNDICVTDQNHHTTTTLFAHIKYFCLLFCFLYNLTIIIILSYEVIKQ